VLGLLYLGARETPVFALRHVEVAGAPPEVRAQVLRAIDGLRGQSLVALDGKALVRRLEAIPSVRSVGYDRAFPHTLRLVVQPERPLAVVYEGANPWIVSVRGRVIARPLPRVAHGLPRVHMAGQAGLAPGGFVADAATVSVLRALAEAPRRFPLPIHAGRLRDGELTLRLEGAGGTRPELRLGDVSDAALKLRVAALVLRRLTAEERASLAYLDVSLPDRPVVG
jgi:cell division septal protein FtsQ